jgi:large subunit ribosomal protein L20
MPRVKRGPRRARRRKKILDHAKGYFLGKSKLHRLARLAVHRAWEFAHADRRKKKRQFRSLWIIRINAAAAENDISYSRLMGGLKKAGVDLDRSVLADIAINDPKGFTAIAKIAQEAWPELKAKAA